MESQFQLMVDLGLMSKDTKRSLIAARQVERNLMGSQIIKDDKFSEIDPRKLPTYVVAKATLHRWLTRNEIGHREYHERMAILLSAERGLITASDAQSQTATVRTKYREENENIHEVPDEPPF